MISFDIETLGISSSSVILSVAAIRFGLGDIDEFKNTAPNDIYRHYLKNSCFVKFKVDEQFKMKRLVDDSTMEWWSKQNQLTREKSFKIDPARDVGVVQGLKTLYQYCTQGDPEPTMWARGNLDQLVFDDLCDQFKQPKLPFWKWMDFRTAVNLMKETAVRGYCEIPGFDRQFVVKHDPVHDAAYDIMMFLWGK